MGGLAVQRGSGNYFKAHVLVKAHGFWVLFIHVHVGDVHLGQGMLHKLSADALVTRFGCHKKHFDFVVGNANKTKDFSCRVFIDVHIYGREVFFKDFGAKLCNVGFG